MKVALGQFVVEREWQNNAATILALMADAKAAGADMLVLPEGILARDASDPAFILSAAQPLDGPFVSQIRAASQANPLTVILNLPVPCTPGKVWNTLIAVRHGEIIAEYRKLHLYDAFAMQESQHVTPGETIPPLITVAGFKVGLMTCYDIRFPEMARRLVLDGAEILAMPAAWLKGALKEAHWELMVRARALENTTYVVAAGECGVRNIGCSMVVDPLGVVIAQAAEAPALLVAEIDARRLASAREALPVLVNRRFAAPRLADEPGA